MWRALIGGEILCVYKMYKIFKIENKNNVRNITLMIYNNDGTSEKFTIDCDWWNRINIRNANIFAKFKLCAKLRYYWQMKMNSLIRRIIQLYTMKVG